MRPRGLLGVLIFCAAPIAAQQTDLCDIDGPRAIHGIVLDTLGVPIDSGSVILTRYATWEGRRLPQRCSAPISADGSFEFQGVVSDSLSLLATARWPTFHRVQVPEGIGDVSLTVTVTTPPQRVRDFDALDDRPQHLLDAEGIAGCYWLGHVMGSGRTVELGSDGTVDWEGPQQPYHRWERLEADSVRVFIWNSERYGWAGFTMSLTSPIDWSEIPALFESKTDAIIQPNEWESFVTRIPCAGSLQLGISADAITG